MVKTTLFALWIVVSIFSSHSLPAFTSLSRSQLIEIMSKYKTNAKYKMSKNIIPQNVSTQANNVTVHLEIDDQDATEGPDMLLLARPVSFKKRVAKDKNKNFTVKDKDARFKVEQVDSINDDKIVRSKATTRKKKHHKQNQYKLYNTITHDASNQIDVYDIDDSSSTPKDELDKKNIFNVNDGYADLLPSIPIIKNSKFETLGKKGKTKNTLKYKVRDFFGRPLKQTKKKKTKKYKNRVIALNGFNRLSTKKTRRRHYQNEQNNKNMTDIFNNRNLHSMAASDLVRIIMSGQKLKTSTNFKLNDHIKNKQRQKRTSIAETPETKIIRETSNMNTNSHVEIPYIEKFARSRPIRSTIMLRTYNENKNLKTNMIEKISQYTVRPELIHINNLEESMISTPLVIEEPEKSQLNLKPTTEMSKTSVDPENHFYVKPETDESEPLNFNLKPETDELKTITFDAKPITEHPKTLDFYFNSITGNTKTLDFNLIPITGNAETLNISLKPETDERKNLTIDVKPVIDNPQTLNFSSKPETDEPTTFNLKLITDNPKILNFSLKLMIPKQETLEEPITVNLEVLNLHLVSITKPDLSDSNQNPITDKPKTIDSNSITEIPGPSDLHLESLTEMPKTLDFFLKAIAKQINQNFSLEFLQVPGLTLKIVRPRSYRSISLNRKREKIKSINYGDIAYTVKKLVEKFIFHPVTDLKPVTEMPKTSIEPKIYLNKSSITEMQTSLSTLKLITDKPESIKFNQTPITDAPVNSNLYTENITVNTGMSNFDLKPITDMPETTTPYPISLTINSNSNFNPKEVYLNSTTVKALSDFLIDFISVPDSSVRIIRRRRSRSMQQHDGIINKRINDKDKSQNNRDLVLDAVKALIKNEKTRQRFDVVNPPNSRYSKRQQLLWDRLRIKAAEELLLHPKPLPQRPTERIFDNLKSDLELAGSESTEDTILFREFKSRIEQQYYLDLVERGQRRVLISTLKPLVS